MHMLRTLTVLAALALLAACASSGPRIQSDYDQNVDFSDYRTFGFFNPMSIEGPNYSTIYGSYFRDAIRAEMNARGYAEADTETADLLFNVSASLNEKINVTEVPSPGPGYYGYRRGFYDPWYGYGWGSTTHVSQYTEGTVNVDMVDREQKRMVWEGVAIGTVREGRSREDVRAAIRDAVSRMFAGYPFTAASS